MAGNPKFHAILKKMAATHDKKSADYASNANYYSNFEQAAITAGCPVDMVFRVLIGVKLARLTELQGKGKVPNNESILDSMEDLAVYAALYASYYEKDETLNTPTLDYAKILDGVASARPNPSPGMVIVKDAWKEIGDR